MKKKSGLSPCSNAHSWQRTEHAKKDSGAFVSIRVIDACLQLDLMHAWHRGARWGASTGRGTSFVSTLF